MSKSQLDIIIELAKRRGFFFPSAELYPSTAAGTWDYGPHGIAMKQNLSQIWHTFFVHQDRLLEISGSTILPEQVFVASGHLASFVDPLTQCETCKTVFRADKIIQDKTGQEIPEGTDIAILNQQITDLHLHCPKCGGPLQDTRHFNLMFKLEIGATSNRIAYLRPETCQNIFIDFNRIARSMRQTLPFGIAQVGESYRNEISPRRGLIRMRQFTQAEAEIFFNPKKINDFPYFDLVKNYMIQLLPQNQSELNRLTIESAFEKQFIKGKVIAYYLARLQQFIEYLGVPKEKYRYRELGDDERPFYALQAFDLEILTSWGWQEIAGNHYRTDHDLNAHMKESNKDLHIMDGDEKVTPHVWEFSLGLDRLLFVLLDLWYTVDADRKMLSIPIHYAPSQVGIFPLVRKDQALVDYARKIDADLRSRGIATIYDEKSTIGRRYARVDEIGCPFAVTIDQETLSKDVVTLRFRDTKKQISLPVKELASWLESQLSTEYPLQVPLL